MLLSCETFGILVLELSIISILILNKINAIRNLDTATFISYTYYKSDLALPLIDQSEQIDQLVNIPFGQLLES